MSGSTPTSQQAIKAAAETAPPLAVAGYHYLLQMPIEKWVSVATLLYVLLQVVVLARKEFFKRKGGRK
jgi:hypothetical protein